MKKRIFGYSAIRIAVVVVVGLTVQPVRPVWAEDSWETIGRDRDREVQIDRRTILQSEGSSKVAWGRIVLSPTEAEKEGYASIKALNRFDCFNRSFQTVKRVYLDAQNMVLRDENVVDQKPVLAARNSVDERMWREVCQPAGSGNPQQLAAEASRKAAEAEADRLVVAAITGAAGVSSTAAAKPAPTKPDTPKATPASDGSLPPPPMFLPAEALKAPAPPAVVAPAPAPAPAPAVVAPAPAIVTPAPVAATVSASAPTDPDVPTSPATPAETRPEPAVQPPVASVLQRTPAEFATSPEPAHEKVNLAASRAATAAKAREVMESVENLQRPSDLPWSFAGETGPEHWGGMRPEWAVCANGDQQSPIDLDEGLDVELEPLVFDYRPSGFRTLDTGQTLVVQVDGGLAVTVRGQRYQLAHLQFHHPMFESIDGKRFDMSVQLHHRTDDGRFLILVLPLIASAERSESVQTIWNNLPLMRDSAYRANASLDVSALLPGDSSHYLYMGSLSQPPCSENITWVVMRTPHAISGEQLRLFAQMYPINARPPQPANDRRVLRSR